MTRRQLLTLLQVADTGKMAEVLLELLSPLVEDENALDKELTDEEVAKLVGVAADGDDETSTEN